MDLLKRVIASVLVVLTILGSIPLDGINIVEASNLTQGTTGTLGAWAQTNRDGGVSIQNGGGFRAAFRVTVMRNSDMYMDGTPETKAKVVTAYSSKYPNIDTYSQSLIFLPNNLRNNYNSASTSIGVALYNRGNNRLMWRSDNFTNQLVTRLTGGSGTSVGNGHTLNKAKIAIQNAGYLTVDGKGKLLSELKNGEWQKYMSSVSFTDAVNVWNHILTYQGGYDVNTRLDKVVSQYVSQGANLQTLPAGQKHDISAGYLGLLMTLYRVAQDRGLDAQSGTISRAIEDYVSSSDIVDKPVALVIDTAVPTINHTEYGDKHLIIPSIDYMEYVGLIPADASLVASAGSHGLGSGNTKNMILEGANVGLTRFPLSSTINGTGLTRIADGRYNTGTSHQINVYNSALGWGATVPGFPNVRLSTFNGYAEWRSSKVDTGFIDMVTFDGNTKGFIISSMNLVEEEPKVTYKVDTSMKDMLVQGSTAKPVVENTVTFTIEAQSSLISILEAELYNGGNPTLEITAKVNRERYIQGNEDEGKKELPGLSAEISRSVSGAGVIPILQGNEQLLTDVTHLMDSFDVKENENLIVKYVYYIDELKIKISTFEREYIWEDIVFRIEGEPQHYVEHIATMLLEITQDEPERIPTEPPEDDEPQDPDEWVPSTMVNPYVYTTSGTKQFAEIKNNKIGNERYEVMAGVPSTEEIYFSAGGTEYMLSIVLQYWVNESGVERTYRSYYTGTSCEYKAADDAGSGSIGGYTVALHNGSTHTKTWTGSIPNNGVSATALHSATSVAVPDRSEYDAAMVEALAYIEEVNNTTLDHTAGSDGFTRSQTGWSAHISTDAPNDPKDVTVSLSCSYVAPTPPSGDPPSGGDPGVPCGNEMATADPGPDGTFTIAVTFIVPAHIICGPCCTHELPLVQDTWRQGIYYDYVKISQLRLYKIDQGAVTGGGLQELTGMEEIFASIKQGDPTYFMNIAQLSMQSPAKPDLRNASTVDNIPSHNNTMFSDSKRTSTLLNIGMEAVRSESSQFGRLRYTVEPQMHDVVVWNEGVRDNYCDGLAPTKNDSATINKPVAGNGHGDDQPWAIGTLYTNNSYGNKYDTHILRDERNKSAYSDKADDRDVATKEWQKFNERRKKENVATVISDFLILQTSGGDQSIFYFEKKSEPVESQQYFPYVEATQDEMLTSNGNSIFKKAEAGVSSLKDEEYRINLGGYNGKIKEPTIKHEPLDGKSFSVLGVGGGGVKTILDNDPAGTIVRPPHNGKMLMYQDGIKIKTTTPNKVYSFDDAAVFYKQMVGYFSTDLARKSTLGDTVKVLSQVSLGLEAIPKQEENLAKWGDRVGLPFTTKYTEEVEDRVNSVIVFSPVSTEDATILPLSETKPLIVNGKEISRDQRYDGDRIPNLNEQISNLMVCPLDPGLCEFRTLNCKYSEDNLLAQFDFESTYTTKERKTIGNKVEVVDVSKPNTYQSGSKWVTTNKVTGIEYVLPSGFTVGNSGKVGSGGYLEAKGTRWSIPFSDLGITNDKNNVVSVKMDFYMDSSATGSSMIVSFHKYDFYLYTHNTGSNYNGLFNTGEGTTGSKGAGLVDRNFKGQKMTLELDFSFNNVMDSKAKINGVPVNVRVQSSQPVWRTVGGIRQQAIQTVALDRTNSDTVSDTMPDNLTKDFIGNTLNIGSWGANNSYPANFYLDNLEVWLKGGTHEHNSTCYTNLVMHETKKIHVHDENCYTKGETYSSCNNALNANYQHKSSYPNNYYGSPTCGYTNGGTKCGLTESGSGVYNMVKSDDDSGPSLEAYISYYLSAGQSIKIQMGGYGGGSGSATLTTKGPSYSHNSGQRSYSGYFEGSGSYVHEFVVSVSGTYTFETSNRTNDPYLGLYVRDGHRHVSSCYHYHTGSAGTSPSGCYSSLNTHRHSGTAGTDSPNGCYTNPTEHKHTAACGGVPTNTLQCTGELNTESDYNVHIHTSECLTTQTVLPNQIYNYTGNVQLYDVPVTGMYTIKAWGASGGGTKDKNQGSAAGYGGFTEGKIRLTKGERLYIYVGGEGKASTALNNGGGWNGGGHGGPSGYGGGGATDIRTYRGNSWDDTRSLLSRLIVAGGGGGADNAGGTLGGSDDGRGGNGGNLVGENAKINGVYSANTGGTQTSGNALGAGANVTTSTDTGGGGGGYYGGKATNNNNGGAGGGSSYISGHTGSNSLEYEIAENGTLTNIRHTGRANHYSGKVFSNTKMESGKQIGNGRVEIIPDNLTYPNIVDKIAEGDYSASEMEDLLGKELMSKLWGSEKLMFTWSNWTSSNMKGFNPNTTGIGSTISAVSGNLRIVQNSSNWELKVPVDIPSSLISRIELVIDNNTTATGGRLAASSGINTYAPAASGTNFSMQANTANQTIVIKPNSNWIDNIGTLWFDIGSGALHLGTITVKAIRLYGYGETQAGTGEVQTVTIKTPQQTTETTTVPKYMKKTTTTRYTNGVAGTSSSTEVEVTSMGTPTSTDTTISSRTKLVGNGDSWTFSYTGTVQTFKVPASGSYRLEVYGAQGGSYVNTGGLGGYSKGTKSLNSGENLYIVVGGQGGSGTSNRSNPGSGGYNGGGTGGTAGANSSGSGGGGATHIATRTGLLSSLNSYRSSILIVGGGGGGAGSYSGGDRNGGNGGGTSGTATGSESTSQGRGGGAGTQTSGGATSNSSYTGLAGSFGKGGNGYSGSSGGYGGGGGGAGWFGGGSGGTGNSTTSNGGGGGGSGYIGGVTSATTTAGSRSGNGRAVITSLQDIYTGNNVFDRVVVTYYETTKTTSTPKTVVKETKQTSFDPLKITYSASENVYNIPNSYTFTAQQTGIHSFEGWGASGSGTNNTVSGKGGYTYGEIHLNKGETVYVYVGEKGTGNSEDYPNYTFNGGGHSGTVHDHLGGRGGGATDFRLNSGSWDNVTGLRSRIMVAGGGGGRGCASNHLINGDAGGLVGSDTLNGGTSYYGYVAKGGSQTTGSVGHRNGNTISTTFTKAGSFGKGGIEAQCGAGGGGGYYGGGTTYTAGGAGGSSFISGMAGANAVNANGTHRGNPTHYSGKVFTNTVMKAGNEVMPSPSGGTQVGHTGDGFARVRFIPDKPQGAAIKTTILNNIDLIPDLLPDGTPNPIFLCKGLPYNAHVCTENCRTIKILNCTEPHHSGEHYDSSNKVCWEPCNDDSNHRIAPLEVEIEPGRFVQNADFLQLDEEFTVYFPNQGDFGGNNALGLKTLQSQTGKGYSNNMDTELWTREKRIKFSFDVLYDNGSGVHMYKAGMWIELPVPQEYFDFYIPVAVPEASNATVEFEVEAINNGVADQTSLHFSDTITSTYKNALANFKKVLEPRWISALSSGYAINTGYSGYFTFKKGEENKLNNAVTTTRNIINSEFPDINERAKPITANDNYAMMSNRKRSSSLEHLHGGYKTFFIDLIGRIGNFAISDTEDFRFSNFFKMPIVDPPEWFIEGFIYEVDEGIQNKYIGDPYDVRGNKINEQTRWLNTYGSQTWMQGTFETGRSVNSPNIDNRILSDEINNIIQLKGEQLRFGYDIYPSIVTFGDYQAGNVLVTPYYYALNLETGEMLPIDVYISKDGIYEPVNIFGNSLNGVPIDSVYDYVLNLDWRKESLRRNYTLEEKIATEKVAEYKKTIIYDYSGYDELTRPAPGFEFPIIGEKAYEVPSGAYNYLGTAQSILMNSSHRTFIGSEFTNGYSSEISKWGYNKNPGGILNELDYTAAVQRWHFKIGIPSSSVFVKHGVEPIQEEIEKIMNPDYAIISTASIISQGNVWTLEYSQPWVPTISINGKHYNIGDDIPPIIAVYSSDNSSVLDIDVIKTH